MRNADKPAAVVEFEWDGTQYTGMTKLETVAMAAMVTLIAGDTQDYRRGSAMRSDAEIADQAFIYAEAFFKRADKAK